MSNTSFLMGLLFAGTRQRVLAVLLLQPEDTFHLRELARLTGTNAGTLARELDKLTEAGLLLRSEQGNQVRYRANRDCLLFDELAGIFRKTHGASVAVAEILAPLGSGIRVALIFGSVARGAETAGSDIDLLVLGDIGFAELVQALHPVQERLRREINPVLYSVEDFAARTRKGDAFTRELLAKPKLFLIGTAHDLAELAGDQAATDPRR